MNLGDIEEKWDPAISGFRDEAQAGSAQKNYDQYNAGQEEARGLLKPNTQFNDGLAFKSPASAAIGSKVMQDYKVKEDALALRLRKMGEDDNLKKLEVAGQLANEEINLNAQKRLLKDKMKRAKKAARGQMIGTVLGIVGMGVGAYAGGPMGAAAGAQLGQGVGSGMGSM